MHSKQSAQDNGALWTTILNGKPTVLDRPSGVKSVPPTASSGLIRRKIVGIKKADVTSSAKIVASTAGVWHIFVGRMAKNNSEADIKEFLEGCDITVSEVRKLQPKEKWQEK